MPKIAKQPRTCPCQLLPQSLSSFSAAEYGDIHSLSKIKDIATRTDDAGYNLLHYSAQFNHVATTAFLLQSGCPVDGGGHCGATPLHRAAFSGATAAMKVLLEWNIPVDDDFETSASNTEETSREDSTTARTSAIQSNREFCDLLAQDFSYGDQSTPLHKAAAGGRFLALHMILEALKERDSICLKYKEFNVQQGSSSMPRSTWLKSGLTAKDRYGRTPLEVAHHFFKIRSTERDAVARWDAVAGGVADWGKCLKLLNNAATNIAGEITKTEPSGLEKLAGNGGNSSHSRQIIHNQIPPIPRLPLHLTRGLTTCLNCVPVLGDNENMCLTTSWQSTFQKSLSDSASLFIAANNFCHPAATLSDTSIKEKISMLHQETTEISVVGKEQAFAKESNHEQKEKDAAVHSICTRCQKPTVALYQLPGVGILVCKKCKRVRR